jgi:plasmid stability protein
MAELAKRTTIYLDPDLHRALRIKSVHTQRSMSALVNEALRMATREDQEDLAAFEERAGEPTFTYEGLLKELQAHGKS